MPQPAGANAESALPIAEPCEYASAEREACEILDQAWGGVGNHTESRSLPRRRPLPRFGRITRQPEVGQSGQDDGKRLCHRLRSSVL